VVEIFHLYGFDILKYIFPDFVFTEEHLVEVLNYVFRKVEGDINVVFLDKEKLKDLNKKYRKQNKSTDVLSFSIGEDILGEIYISPEFVRDSYEGEYVDEIIRLIVHGVLHLRGYDHKTEFSEKTYRSEKMYLEQERILKEVLNFLKNK